MIYHLPQPITNAITDGNVKKLIINRKAGYFCVFKISRFLLNEVNEIIMVDSKLLHLYM